MAELSVKKRRVSQETVHDAKRARRTQDNVDNGLSLREAEFPSSLPSVAGQSLANLEIVDDSSINSDDDSDGEVTTITPLTPFSPQTSPRFPSELKTHRCTYPDCGKAFNRPAKLSQHLRSHTNSRPFVCPHQPCTKNFLRHSHLKHHIKSAHSNVRNYVCDWEGCRKSFITATRLKRHYAVHEGKEKYKCNVYGCGQSFRKHGTLQKHLLTVHEGSRAYQCQKCDEDGVACGQGFDTLGKLQAHEGRVHGGKRFWCSICNPESSIQMPEEDTNGFSTYADLQDHIKVCHPPQCGICGLACSSQPALRNHVEVRHGQTSVDERRTHLCPEPDCGRAFTKKGNLNVHIQSAHKAKRYICGQEDLNGLNRVDGWDGMNSCGRALSTKGSLENHIRTVHMGMGKQRSKPTKKTGIGLAGQHDDLDLNLMKLTGVGYEEYSGRHIPCNIPQCDFRFSRRYDLQVHLKARHGLSAHQANPSAKGVDANSEHWDHGFEPARDDQVDVTDPMATQMNLPSGYGVSYNEGISQDGEFWIGGDPGEAEVDDDEWDRDQLEMQRLIDGDDSGAQGWPENAAMIDPLLQ